MTSLRALAVACCLLLTAPTPAPAPVREAVFSDFRYAGGDDADRLPAGRGDYRNPVIAGFRADPTIVRVGGDYYLMLSSVGYWPGLPIYHSRDLVSWRRIGSAIDRPSQMRLDGIFPSYGLYAPDLKYHHGVFYALSTCFKCGGNFVITARDPRGPWSDPTWLPFEGIDPSIFFDADGRTWVLNNGPPEGPPRWAGHRAILIQEMDLKALRMIGPRRVIVDGGADPSAKPAWIEGPHLFRRSGWYYLIAAEGGTGEEHSEVAFRSRSVLGPYEPAPGNPILTQRDLPAERRHPVGAAGHADLVELPDGSWWAVFLGTRPYAPALYNTGRDTFLLPVRWREGWPGIVDRGEAVPRVAPRPPLRADSRTAPPAAGAFAFVDHFTSPRLDPAWMFLRTPNQLWWRTGQGALAIRMRPDALGGLGQPSYVSIRQAHANASAEVTLRKLSPVVGDEAGLVAFQNEQRFLSAMVVRTSTGIELQLRRRLAKEMPFAGETVARVGLPAHALPLALRIVAGPGAYTFQYRSGGAAWTTLGPTLDGRPLTTLDAGGFAGVTLGMYAATPQADP